MRTAEPRERSPQWMQDDSCAQTNLCTHKRVEVLDVLSGVLADCRCVAHDHVSSSCSRSELRFWFFWP